MATPEYGLLTGDAAVQKGLGQAYGLMSNYNYPTYPNFTPSQTTGPQQSAYYNYTPNQPMAQVQTPNYKMNAQAPTYEGLQGGDYAALQQALTVPGEISANNAYQTANRNLNNAMGGRGLYGSSIMSTQANEGLNREYMNAMATNAANAAAQRYGMQATDLQNKNQFGTNVYGIGVGQEQNANQYGLDAAKLGVTQNQNTWQANQTMADQQNAYNLSAMQYGNQGNEATRQWQNQQELEKYQYDLARQAYQNQQNEAMVNQYLALAGQGAPLSAANTNYQQAMQQIAAQQEIAAQQGTGQLLGGLLNLGGTLGSALISKP